MVPTVVENVVEFIKVEHHAKFANVDNSINLIENNLYPKKVFNLEECST